MALYVHLLSGAAALGTLALPCLALAQFITLVAAVALLCVVPCEASISQALARAAAMTARARYPELTRVEACARAADEAMAGVPTGALAGALGCCRELGSDEAGVLGASGADVEGVRSGPAAALARADAAAATASLHLPC